MNMFNVLLQYLHYEAGVDVDVDADVDVDGR